MEHEAYTKSIQKKAKAGNMTERARDSLGNSYNSNAEGKSKTSRYKKLDRISRNIGRLNGMAKEVTNYLD